MSDEAGTHRPSGFVIDISDLVPANLTPLQRRGNTLKVVGIVIVGIFLYIFLVTCPFYLADVDLNEWWVRGVVTPISIMAGIFYYRIFQENLVDSPYINLALSGNSTLARHWFPQLQANYENISTHCNAVAAAMGPVANLPRKVTLPAVLYGCAGATLGLAGFILIGAGRR